MYFENDNKLVLKNGVYISNEIGDISFPETGYEACFQIEENSFWFNHRNDCLATVIENYSIEKTFFDVGGGNGYVSKHIQDKGFDTYLVEPGLDGILNAQKRGVKNLINSVFDDNFKNSSIPNIGIFDVLEHINNDKSFLENLNKKLQTNGVLYLTVPAYQFLWSFEDVAAGHFRRYTKKKLEELLKNTNFDIVYSTYIFHFLPLPVFVFRTLPSLLTKRKEVNNAENEHKKNNSKILDCFLKKELDCLKKHKSIPFGGSCLIVAKKK